MILRGKAIHFTSTAVPSQGLSPGRHTGHLPKSLSLLTLRQHSDQRHCLVPQVSVQIPGNPHDTGLSGQLSRRNWSLRAGELDGTIIMSTCSRCASTIRVFGSVVQKSKPSLDPRRRAHLVVHLVVAPVEQALRRAQHRGQQRQLPRQRLPAAVRALPPVGAQQHDLGADGGRAEGGGRLRLHHAAREKAAAQLRACGGRTVQRLGLWRS